MRSVALRLSFLVALATAAPAAAFAQCADGSAPPCRGRVRPDSNVFMVLPFVVRGPAALQYLDRGMADLLHMALDGVGAIRVEYAPSALRRLDEVSGAEVARNSAGPALELGAGRLIGGTIVVTGSELRINAEIFDAIRGRSQFSVVSRASLEHVGSAVDSLAAAILARRLAPAAEREGRSVELRTKSAAALQAYVRGRQLNLRGLRREAAESLKVALRQDPTFAAPILLLLRIESAHQGITGLRADDLLAHVRTAQKNRERVGERAGFVIDVRVASSQLERDQALTLVDRFAQRFPGDAEAAFYLADMYFHFGINLGAPLQRVIGLFEDALRLDSQDPELLVHVRTLYEEAGDTAAARKATERCSAVGLCRGDSDPAERVARGADPGSALTGRDSLWLPPLAHHVLRGALSSDPARGLAITDTIASLQTAPTRPAGVRAIAYVLRHDVALARGQYGRAWAFLDSARSVGGAPGPYRLVSELVSGVADRFPAPPPRQPSRPYEMAFAWNYALLKPADTARKAIAVLETWAYPDSLMGVAMAAGLRGIVALRGGDTAQALLELRRVRSNHKRRTVTLRNLIPGAWLSFTLAELEAARGDFAAARRALADLYPVNDYVAFIAPVEELRARVALALADTASAKRSLRIMTEVWKDADPELQPRVAAARALLVRLEATSK